jgi:oligopeptide transport system permease protein
MSSGARIRLLALVLVVLVIAGANYLPHHLLADAVVGARGTLFVGLTATLVAVCIGLAYGAFAALLGPRYGQTPMRLCDGIDALPKALVLVLVLVLGRASQSRFGLLFHDDGLPGSDNDARLALGIAIGLVQWTTLARAVRSQLEELARSPFVDAARGFGVSLPRVLVRHILPNVGGPIVAYATLTLPTSMSQEALISFLGIGTGAHYSSLGTQLREGLGMMSVAPLSLLVPALTLSIVLVGLRLVGDWFRSVLDPAANQR